MLFRSIYTLSLHDALPIFGDNALIQDDEHRFEMAHDEYKSLVREKGELDDYLEKRKHFGQVVGRQIALIASATISIVIVTGYVVLHFTRGG